MSKQRTSVLLSLCIAFVLSVAVMLGAWLAGNSVRAFAAVDASLGTFRFLSVGTSELNGTEKVSFVINKNLGGNPYAVTSLSTDKVVYNEADGGTRTLTSVNYVWDSTHYLPKLVFSFSEDQTAENAVQYAVGDTITISGGFTFKDWQGVDLGISFADELVVTYTAEGWTGTFLDSQLTVSASNSGFSAGVNVSWGITGVAANQVFIDTQDWGASNEAWAAVSPYVSYTSTSAENVYSRSWLSASGEISLNNSGNSDKMNPVAGDIIRFKAGFPMLVYTGTPNMFGAGTAENSYVPLFVLHEDVSLIYDGAKWYELVPATTAEVANLEAVQGLRVGQNVQIQWTLGEGEYEIPTYESNNDQIATVSETGVITGVAEGEVTITAHFSEIGDKQIAITVKEALSVTSFRFDIKGAATRDGKQFLVAYVGEELDKTFAASRLTATPVFNDGSEGTGFAVTADMISLDKFSNAQEGETAITVTSEAYPGVSSDVPVYVYEVHEVNDYVDPSRLLSRSDSSINIYLFDVVDDNQGESQNVQIIDFRNSPEYGITKEIATMVEPSWVENPAQHELYTVGEITQIQMLVYFGGFYSNGDYNIPAGTVLTFTEDFRMYRPIDGTWVAYYKFPGEAKYVWDGSAWQNFVADATGFTLEETEVTLPNGATYAPKVAVAPSGAYGELSFAITSGSEYITVEDGAITAVAPGTATVEISMGKLSGTQTITVTVKDTEAAGIVLDNDRTFHLSEDDTALKLGNIDVKIDYGDGYYSDVISLDKSAVTVGEYTLDTSVGTHTVSLNVTINDNGVDISDTIEIETEVHEVIEVYPDNMNIPMDPNFWGETLFLIYFQKTFPNTANVYASALGADGKNVTDYMQYIRADGTEATINNPGFLQNMLGFDVHVGNQYIGVDKNESGDSYLAAQDGDKIILKKGMCFYRWFGDEDSNHNVTGDGDYVKVGELAYDVVFEYSQGQNAFNYTIAPVDGVVLEETVSIGLGQQHAANVQTIPSYATHGEWFYEVADEKVATVSVSGMITGKAIGSTTVTAELRYNDAVIKSVSFTVTVTDSVTGLQITSSKPLAVDLGTEMDIAGWISEFGITARAVYASGTVGTDAIDLTDARVTGYDAETEGQQTLTFRVTVDGRSVTGTITITVGAAGSNEKGGGCSSAVAGTGIVAAAGLLFAGAAVLCLKKKKD